MVTCGLTEKESTTLSNRDGRQPDGDKHTPISYVSQRSSTDETSRTLKAYCSIAGFSSEVTETPHRDLLQLGHLRMRKDNVERKGRLVTLIDQCNMDFRL